MTSRHNTNAILPGLLSIQGNWEPRAFLLRRGDSAFCDVDELWRRIHSPEELARLKQLGINLSILHGHKGFGLQAEEGSIREAAGWAQQLREHDIRVGVYIGCTFFPETFRDVPLDEVCMQHEARGWSDRQYYRTFWSWFRPPAMEYMREVIRRLIEEVNPDLLHFDASFSHNHHNLCHSPETMEAFNSFVARQMPELRELAGLGPDAGLMPPPCGSAAVVGSTTRIQDPVAAAWAVFHAEAGTRALRELIAFARSLNPHIAVLFNGASLCGIHPFCRAENDLAKVRLCDLFWTEDSVDNPVGLKPSGGPLSRFRAYKFAHRARARSLYYTVEEGRDNLLMLAESAAFNYQTLGCMDVSMQRNHQMTGSPDVRFHQMLRERPELFTNRRPWVQTAVLRHNRSELLNPFPSGLAPYVIEQFLFEEHHAFTLITEEDLTIEGLAGLELVILPESCCLNDAESALFRNFAEQGGCVLLLGHCGTATTLNRWRPWAWRDLFPKAPGPTGHARYEETADQSDASDGASRANEGAPFWQTGCGKGCIAYLPRIEYMLPPPDRKRTFGGVYPWYSHEYWEMPANVDSIRAAVASLLPRGRLWTTSLPRHAGVEGYQVPEGIRFFLLNYAHGKQEAPASSFEVRLQGDLVSRVEFSTLEESIPVTQRSTGSDRVVFDLPAWPLLAWVTLHTSETLPGSE